MADRLALGADGRGLGAEIAVGVDLHLDAAIAENTFGHDRDHVDAVDLRGNDKGRRLVIGIGGAGADRSHEHAGFVNQLAIPVAAGLERHQPSAMRHRSLQHDMRIDAHQFAVVIGIAIARARRARLDVAHHRTGIAADLVADGGGRNVSHEQACSSGGRDRSRSLADPIHLFVHERFCAWTEILSSGNKSENAGLPHKNSFASPPCS